jgi:hypothetical protein
MLHKNTSDKRVIVLLFLGFSFFCCSGAIILAIVHNPFPITYSVATEVKHGVYAVIVRFPSEASVSQEELIIFENNAEFRTPRRVTRGPVDNTGMTWDDYTVVQLTEGQWRDIDMLRQTWCHQPPTFRTLQQDDPFYDVGLDCGFRTKRVKVPTDQLPVALIELIGRVPSPRDTPER